jgi:hypothetical protein
VSRAQASLLIGIPIALVLGLGGPIAFAGWFLTSLVHEMGHSAVALFFGCFAVPAIRLDGHAAAVHSCQNTLGAIFVWVALGILAWRFRDRRPWLITFVVAAALYPLFAFTDLKEFLHLIGGHAAELIFATIFFWRALTGGFVDQPAERPFYAALGWLWSGGAVVLFASLTFSAASRDWYLQNGSFGLENDLIRIARLIGVSLPVVSFPLLLVSFLPLPLAFLLARQRTPSRAKVPPPCPGVSL